MGAGSDAPGTLARRLLDGISLALVLLDGEARVQLANAAAGALFGGGPGALAGRALVELFDEDAATLERALSVARTDGHADADGWRMRGDGVAAVRARVEIDAVRDEDGAGGFTLAAREEEARGEVEAQLRARLAREEEARLRAEEASRARDEFLATLSHELRTPLTAIMGWAHLLRAGNLDEAGRARALETIERNAHLEAQLTADILDVARIITGKLRVQLQRVDPGKVVAAALEAVGQDAESRRIAVDMKVEGDPGPVAADPDRLQQVVSNLLTNALKFTPEGGRVDVRVARVFERFSQAGARGGRKGGLGLGLAIVHHIVELHSGHVYAASEGVGRGAVFTVRLPAITGRSTPATTDCEGERVVPTPLHDVTVLVVDDQEDARELMSAVLGRCGARVVAVDSTAAALEALDRVRPDVILSDLEMPGEDGYSLIRKVRERPPEKGGTVPAAALTAYARTEDRLHSLRAGFHRHVPKPVQPDELAEIVASLAGRRT
ncbi:MAG: hybrid sensor histidine kinase/response regulator [Acidobacteria bacterium]|nr:MAG: hybrid sensor histidine kinase/response regulator [Acidobacteriota bacterium]